MGKNMKKKLPLKITFFLAAYIALIISFIIMVFAMPSWLRQAEEQYRNDVQQGMAQVFMETTEKELPQKLMGFRSEYPIEIIVINHENETIYSSIPGLSFSNAHGVIPQSLVILEAKGDMQGKDEEYLSWFTIYRPTFEFYLKNLLTVQMFFVLLSFLILVLISYYLYRELISPLKMVKKNLAKLENYQLDEVDAESEDAINEGMHRFAINLQDNISSVSQNHTKLEYTLQLERERLQNMITVSRGIIHDLKTPLYQTMLENEVFLSKQENPTEQVQGIVQYNVNRLDKVMQQITDVLKMMGTDVKEMMEVKDAFDFVSMVKEVRVGFVTMLDEKNVWLTTDTPEHLLVHVNKVTSHLILHNILFNAIQYAKKETEILLEVFEEEHELFIRCTNEATPENMKRIQKSEYLFNNIDKSEQNEEYIYSTGNGVYLIRELTYLLNGTYDMSISEDEVSLEVKIPLT